MAADIFGTPKGIPRSLRARKPHRRRDVDPRERLRAIAQQRVAERPRVKQVKQAPFTNTAPGNPRQGQQFDIVNQGGKRYHQYASGVRIADRELGPHTTPTRAPAPPAPAPTPAAAAPAPRPAGALSLNQVKGNPRFGQSYRTVTKGGRTFHRYKDGQMIGMGPAKPAAAPAGFGALGQSQRKRRSQGGLRP